MMLCHHDIHPSDQHVRCDVPSRLPQVSLLSFHRHPRRLENLVSIAVPLPFALLPIQVVIISSSNFAMVCPRLKKVTVTINIPADEMHDDQLRRITKFVEARYDSDFPLSSLDVDVSVATPISEKARAEYSKTWNSLVEDVTFPVRFEGRSGHSRCE